MSYSLKDVAENIAKEYPTLCARVVTKSNQIILSTGERDPKNREIVFILSPYYQQRIAQQLFNDEDMQAILIEVDRFCRLGY